MSQATKFVYAFSEGSRDQRDLLGGKGANLAEMTNLGLPVPPGFTISTEACRAYLEHGSEPDELAEGGRRAPRRPGGGDGAGARAARRSAAGLGAVRGQVLDARDDGDGPQRRPQRRVGARPRRPRRRGRALRLRLLPSAAADVRQHRARHRGLRVRRGAGRSEDEPGRGRGRRPPGRGPDRPGHDVQEDHRGPHRRGLPPGPPRADGHGGAGGLRLVEHRARRALPPSGAHPRRSRHRRQHLLDGVRQRR